MKTNYWSVPVTDLNPSLVTIAAWDKHTKATSHERTKRTKISAFGLVIVLAAFLGSCVVTELHAQVIVVPNSLGTNDGNSFNTTPSGPGSVREMQIYDSSQFAALSEPSFLTQFAYRPDKTPGPSGPRAVSLRIFASTSSRAVDAMSPTLANNHGADKTLVYDGKLIWQTANLPGPGNTRQFDVVFPLTTPFLYNRAAGNLLLEIQFTADGSSIRIDTVMGNQTLGELVNVTSNTGATGVSATPKVTQFTFALPPVISIRASQVQVCWNSISNVTYQVQYRSDLTTNIWTSLVDCVRSVGSTSCIVDPVVAGQPQRFYRAVMTNCVPR